MDKKNSVDNQWIIKPLGNIYIRAKHEKFRQTFGGFIFSLYLCRGNEYYKKGDNEYEYNIDNRKHL